MSEPSPYVYNGTGLPPYLKDQLANWPATGSGTRAVHRHMLAQGREIVETVARAYGIGKIVPKWQRPPDFLPNVDLIENIVAERIGSKRALEEVEALEASSPAPIPAATEEAMHRLFEPDDFICHANDWHRPMTRQLRQIILNGHNGIRIPELVVPSPMTATCVLDKDGKRHYRTNANTGPRKFLVTNFDIKPENRLFAPLIAKWTKHKVTIQDAMAALIRFLADKGPLSMVTFSGNVSLQAWWYCAGEREALNSPLRKFFEDAVILGADPAGWVRCQLFRMPGAQRSSTGLRQTIHFFNPPIPHTTMETPINEEEGKDSQR